MNHGAERKHQFYTEMAKLLGAGFGIRKAATVMLDSRPSARQRGFLRCLIAGLDARESVSDTFTRNTRFVGGLERSMIDAGERSGRLVPTFVHLAEYFGMVASAKRAVIRAMIYPMIILHLGLFLGTIPLPIMGGEGSAGELTSAFAHNLLALYAALSIVFSSAKRS